jgi:hypothetical protein
VTYPTRDSLLARARELITEGKAIGMPGGVAMALDEAESRHRAAMVEAGSAALGWIQGYSTTADLVSERQSRPLGRVE